jgi:hypothetical protein
VYVDQDRVTVTRGRMFNRALADEIVVSAGVAKALAADGIHLGGIMHLGDSRWRWGRARAP